MRQMKTCINKIIYTSLLLGLAALAASSLWSAQPKPAKATPGNIIVEIKKAEIKLQPTAGAGIIAVAFKGEIFKVLHELPGWYLIELSPGKEGYLAKKYARVKSAAKTKKIVTRTIKPILLKRETTENFVLIVSTGSYIRTSPAVNGKILAQAKINNAFRLLKKVSPDWYEAALPTGKKCYIPANIARMITTSELSQLKEQWKTAAVHKAAPQSKTESQPVSVVAPQPEPQPKPVSSLYAVALKNGIILRQEPNINARILVTAKQGDNYKLISQKVNWSLVMLTEDQQAYVLTKVVKIVSAADLPAAIAEASKAAKDIKLKYVSVTEKVAKLRAKASDTAKVISIATQGTEFKLVWVYKDWYEVLTSSGTAFISDKSASMVNAEETESQEPEKVPETIQPEEKTIPIEKPAEEIKIKTEEKPTETKPAESTEEAWLKDKYVLVTNSQVNVRESANRKSKIMVRVNAGAMFKLLARNKEWYEIFLPPDQNAFIAASLTEIITEADVLAGPKKWQETQKERQAAELKAKQLRAAEEMAKRQAAARLVAEAKVREEAERKLRLEKKEAEAKALKETARKARLENEKKTKEDAERRAKAAAELKVREEAERKLRLENKEAEARAKEQEWLKDKYMLVKVKKAVLQNKPDIKGKIIATVNIGDSYKLVSRSKEWSEISFSTGTAFINNNLGTILSATALAEYKQKEAEEKTRKEEELKAKLENERKIKEDSERRAKAAAELKVREEAERKLRLENKEAEARAKEQEWLKDKYIIVTGRNINLRQAPNKTAAIAAKTKTGESFKLVSRSKGWYEVRLSSGVAFIAANLADIISEKELEVIRDIEKEATELKERQEAEGKAVNEAWCKDKYVVVMTSNANLRSQPAINAKILTKANKGDIFKILDRGKEWYEIFLPPDQNAFISISLVDILTEGEVESRIRKEREPILARAAKEAETKAQKLRAATELKERQEVLRQAQEAKDLAQKEAERKSKLEKLEAEQKTAELKAREDAAAKAKELEWLKDKYVLVEKQTSFYPAPNIKAAVSGTAAPDTSNKIVTRTKKWYGIDTSSGTAFVPIDKVKLLTEQELTAYRQRQAQSRQEKLKKEAAEKTRKEEELNAKLEAERKAKEETARQEAEAKANKESFVQDKYILLLADNTNLRSAPNKSSPIITRARSGEYFKLVWIAEDAQKIQWYQVDITSGKQIIKAYVNSALAQAVSKAELDSFLLARQKENAEKPKLEAEQNKGKEESGKQTQPPTAEPGPKETELKTTAATEKPAEAEWLKDKYVLITINNTNLRQAAGKNAAIIAKANIAENYKLTARAKDWYEISLSSGTAFVNAGVVKVVTEQELAAVRQQQEKEKLAAAEAERQAKEDAELKAKLRAEEKAKKEAAEKVREEAERQLRLEKAEAEQKASEEKARLEAEAKAKEVEWLKDKYILIPLKSINLRKAPYKNAELVTKVNQGATFKLLARGKDWYELSLSPGQNAFVLANLVQVISETEVQTRAFREATELAQRQEAERQAREEKARLEATTKAAREAELKVREEAELKLRLDKEKAVKRAKEEAERKAREEAELKARLETERLARLEGERKAKAEAEAKTREEATQREAEAKARIGSYIKDKFILTILDNTNLRTAPDKNSPILAKVNSDVSYKVTWIMPDKQNVPWYQVSITSGTENISAYVISTLAKLMTESELSDHRLSQAKAAEDKTRLETERKAQAEAERLARIDAEQKVLQEAERKHRLEKLAAEQKAREEAEQKAKLLAEAKARKETADKARMEAELKAKEEATQKAKLAAEQKAKDDAEALAREQEWLKDKYVLIINPDTNIRKAPAKNAEILSKAIPDREYKLFSRSKNKEWYEIVSLTGTGFVNAAVVKLLSEQELIVLRQQQEQTRLETLKKETEAKARREAELQAKLETTRKATAEQAKQIEEARAKETAWLKDKYILVPDKNISLRTAPNSTANLIGKTSNANESYKLLSRADRDWYQIQTSTGTAFIAAAAARVMSEQELNIFRVAEQQAKAAAELQAKLAAEEKAKKEAETKAAREAELKAKIEQEQMIREEKFKKETAEKAQREIERQAKLEAEQKAKAFREATELAQRQEAELKARQTAEIKARLENESKAKMEAYVADKYVLVTGASADLKTAAGRKAKNFSRAKAGESFKVSWIENEEWFRVITSNGQTAFLTAATVKLVTEKELSALREAEAKAKLEAELQAKEAAALKEKLAAEEKARKEAALIAKLESDRQAREEKLRQETETQSRLQAERQARLEAEQKAKQEAERKALEAATLTAKLEAEEKAKKETALKAQQEAEQKARAEAERQARETAATKTRIETEAKAKMEAYVKDKYIVIADNNAAVRTAPDVLARVLYVAEENESFKLQWIRENWYEIKVPSGTAFATGFVDVSAAKSMTMTELAAWQKVQEQERLTREAEELKARQQAELKAKEEAALKAKLVAEQKAKAEAERQVREEAERKLRLEKLEAEQKAKAFREATELAKRQEAERQAKEVAEALATEQEWLKDKYVLINTKDTNIRMKASKNADIVIKAPADKDYKLVSRSRNNEWYEIDISSGTAFVNAAVVKVMTDQELAVYRQQQEQARLEKAQKLQEAAALKEQQAAKEKARKEAELKVLQEAERKLRLEKLEASQKAAEEKARIEAEQKAKAVVEKLSREEQARMEATAKARAEAEQKAKTEEEREDQTEYAYIIINASYAEIKSVPDLGAPALLIALKGDIFKYNGQQKGWYNILTFSGETRFVRKSLCRGSNIAPQLVKDESQRKDIYDSLIDAKDRAMSEANQKYPSIKSQSELQEKIFYQQTVEEKFILEVFHKYKFQPATYLTLLSEAISKNW